MLCISDIVLEGEPVGLLVGAGVTDIFGLSEAVTVWRIEADSVRLTDPDDVTDMDLDADPEIEREPD